MSLHNRWLSSLTVLCLGGGLLGGAIALFVPNQQVVRASEHADVADARRVVVIADARAGSEAKKDALDTAGARYRGGMIISGVTGSGAILFTFDDGPDLVTTPRLLDALDRRDTKAIFFIVGERIAGPSRRAAQRKKLVREIAARGHMVGNHTFSHRQLTMLSDTEVRDEILRTERLLTPLIGSRPWLFRPAGGARSERVDAIVAELGYTSVLWNMDTSDTAASDSEAVANAWSRVARTPAAQRGGIVLLHDLLPTSVAGFEKIYDRILAANGKRREQGLVRWRVVSDLDAFFVPRADADASAVAPALR